MDFLLSLIKSLRHQDILSDLSVSVEDVSYAIRDNFESLPSNIREELLLKTRREGHHGGNISSVTEA